ncbi:MAG: hypothetical protein M3Y13_05725 [Armatimonadota bacterium]|nr:hypothetical protein [Armatimonadota bacterium]
MEKSEIVYTVFNYWDGPRAGVADFHGSPHFFQCIFDEVADEWSNVFRLSPVAKNTVSLTKNEWQEWYWWKHDFGQGKAEVEARPDVYARYSPIDGMLFQAFATDTVTASVEVVGEFEAFTDLVALPGTAVLRRVHWLPLEPVEHILS